MANEGKKSIIENAYDDYKQIQEAAEASAAKKLADKFPEKFQEILKEELNKNNKKINSEKEPYKKVDESKESKETLDESENQKENTTMKKETKETKKVVNEERDQDFMGDVEGQTPNLGKGSTEDGDTYIENPTTKKESNANKTSVKESEEVNEEFDVTQLDVDGAGAAMDSASPEDEVVTMDDIEQEIAEMEELNPSLKENENSPYDQLVSMRDKLNEMISGIDEQKNHGGKQNYKGRENGGPTTQMIDEEDEIEEQKNHGGKQNFKGRENGGPTTQMIDEEDDMITDKDIDAALSEEEVSEASGMAHSSSKHVAGDHLPGKEFASQRHKRYGSVNNTNESAEKKFNTLLEENKKLTKKINESKKQKETVDQLLESYKTALEKYRTQLKEMAVFNTNLSHVNNILVNEEIALTQEDKIKIINEFKSAKTIGESKDKYNKILTEMKEERKTISESVEEKVTNSVASSKSSINEVEEKTAYQNDPHIKKVKSLIEYIERNDKKIIK